MYKYALKRGLDIILSFIGCLILWPVFILVMIAIKIDSKGPVFFKQKRVGKDKTYFNILKFRTMYVDTPKDIPTHLLKDPDMYITRVGKFLRKTSLDEIPQILNILAGHMAIVGPRPALWNQYDLIAERDKGLANTIRPGLTGWAQIHGRDELEIEEKARLDNYYAAHLSFLLDLKCFIGTFKTVLGHDGLCEGGTGYCHKRLKKILIVTNHSYMLYRFRKELIQRLLKKCHVVISTPFVGHEEDLKAMGCRCIETDVDRRGMNPVTDMKLVGSYIKLIQKEKPDAVITYSIKPNIYMGAVCRLGGIPYYVNVQGLGSAFQSKKMADIVSMMYRWALKRAKVVFFENKENAREFLKRRIVGKDRMEVLPGAGINLDDYEYAPYKKKDARHFLYLGRIMKEKGMDEWFGAAKRLKNEFGDRVVFDMVGFFEDEYKEIVEKMQEDGIITFHGFQSEPKPYYAMADCVVLPSYHEGMSNVLLEAAAMGRPVVTSDIPGCREAVRDGKTGYVCPPRDAEELYKKMRQIMEASDQELEEMGKRGRKYMEMRFDKNKVVDKTINSIKKIG